MNATKVEVSLKEAISEAPVASEFSVVNEAKQALEVKAVELSADGETLYLTTATQTEGALYVLTHNEEEFKFVGLGEDKVKPQLDSVVATTNTEVLVTFDEEVGLSALVASNYAIEGLTVASAQYFVNASGEVEKDKVVLTTTAQTQGTIYKLVVTNVKDLADNLIDADYDESLFGGLAPDTTKPQGVSAVATTNTTVKVTFNEKVDAVTAENIANYAIEGLSVLKATLAANGTDVVLTTSAQTQGTIYKVVIKDVKDVSGNVLNADYDEFLFGGLAADTTKPVLSSVVAVTNDKVKVQFNEKVDAVTAENIANYAIEGLSVLKAELDKDDEDFVILTTSAQTQGTIYKATVTNVLDASGNVLDTTSSSNVKQFGGLAVDTQKPTVTAATSTGNKQVTLTFSEDVDAKTATVASNYYLGSELGYALKAEIGASDNEVILTTKAQTAAVYTVTVNGVKDLSGNVVNTENKANQATFGGQDGSVTLVGPKVTSAVAVDSSTFVVTFDSTVDATTFDETDFVVDNSVGAPAAIKVSEDKKSVTLQYAAATFTQGTIYKVTVSTDVTGTNAQPVVAGTKDTALFAGTSVVNPDPKVSSAVLTNSQTLNITFSEAITVVGGVTAANLDVTALGLPLQAGTVANVELSSDAKTLTVYLTGATFTQGTLYTTTVDTAKIQDALGVASLTSTNDANKVTFAGIATASAAPSISAITAVNKDTLDIVFNQKVDLTDLGNADITIKDQAGNVVSGTTVALVRAEGTAGTTARVFLTGTALTAGQVYTVEIVNTEVKNLNGATMTATANKGSFAAVSTTNPAPALASATATGNTTVRVTFSEKLAATPVAGNFAIAGITVSSVAPVGTDGKTFDLTVSALTAGTIYEVTLVTSGTAITDEAGVGAADTTKKASFVGK